MRSFRRRLCSPPSSLDHLACPSICLGQPISRSVSSARSSARSRAGPPSLDARSQTAAPRPPLLPVLARLSRRPPSLPSSPADACSGLPHIQHTYSLACLEIPREQTVLIAQLPRRRPLRQYYVRMPMYTLYGAGKSNAPHSSACDLLYPPARSSCSEHEPAASVLRARRSLQHPSRPSALASYYVNWRARKPYQTVGSSLPAVCVRFQLVPVRMALTASE